MVAVYDALDPDRGDLEHYAAMVSEFGARPVSYTHLTLPTN